MKFVGRKRSAKRVKEILESLQEIAGNDDLEGLDFDQVWKSAKNPRHSLHKEFDWDTKRMIARDLREQARKLVADVRYQVITIEGFQAKVRAVVSTKQIDPENRKKVLRGLSTRKSMLASRERRGIYAKDALDELRQWVYRYGDIKELTPIRSMLARALKMKGVVRKVA